MSFTDKIEKKSLADKDKSLTGDVLSASDESNKDINGAKDDMRRAVTGLAKQFLAKVEKGNIAIDDVKDGKEVMNMLQVLNDMNSDNSSTPQITANTANFIQYLTGIPEGSKANGTELENASESILPDNIKEALDKQANEINKANSSKF